MTAQFPADKKDIIEELLAQPVLARLATANIKTGQPHVVPVWFMWDGTYIWISAFSSTRKVRDLVNNPRASVLIEPKETDKLQGVLFEGPVELISQPPELVSSLSVHIYVRYLGVEGTQAAEPQSWANDPDNRIIRLTPRHIAAW